MKKNTLILFLFCISLISNAQDLKTELGLITGMTSMQSDYGERSHFGSSYANIGFGSGIVFYVGESDIRKTWNDRANMFQDHMRLRVEVSYMQTKLVHRGVYTLGSSSSTVLYNAMEGTSRVLNYGAQIEYNIFRISNKQYVDPYLSVGFLVNTNMPNLSSSLGDIETNPSLIPNVYNNGVYLDNNNSTSLIMGFGTRLRPKSYFNNSIYLLDFRWQKFNSDMVDGLTPTIEANKYNDWLLFISAGYIFSLN